ncbi:MAG: 2OG-Fe(II) oxygenase [Novosphingobium sp.]|nr:2OG-Fe(II) oxygenase [Novosphingobium sp.]
MALFKRSGKTSPDQKALARLGEAVRARLAENPHVHTLPGKNAEIFAVGKFLEPGECFRLRAMIDSVAKPSTLYASSKVDPTYRTSYSGNLDRTDSMVISVERRIDDLLGIEPAWGEAIQGQRYTQGQEYRQHHDWFHDRQAYWKVEKKRGGQRSWTAMIYLNNVDEGGETDFPLAGFEVTPEEGALLIWNNADVDGSPNPNTIHTAKPVVQGTKYVMTKWYRTRKWG